jgi:two-component system sensor histidine kinase PilS (NtrC family)
MIWVRVVVFTLFVTAQLTIVRGPREDPTDLLVLLGAVYALSFCWLGLRHLNRSYLNQAYAQIAVDLVLITWTVNRTGTIDSYFGLLYFVAIVMSSILLRRKSSYTTAIAASLLYGVHLDLAYFGVLPSTGSESFPPLINLQIIVGVTIFGFCAVGFLVNTLVETLHVSDVALEESTEQVAFLQALTTRIIDSLGSGLITTDLSGRIFVFNPAAERILGKNADRVVGRAIHEAVKGLGPDIEIGHFELTTTNGDGHQVCLSLSVTTLTTGPGRPTGYVWSFDDVTGMREMEARLHEQEKMAAIGVLSAGIAHEIRNPLASIAGSFGLLRSELDLDRDQQRLAEIILRETERLNHTVTDFLHYARPMVPRMRWTDLARLIRDCVQLLENSTDLNAGHRIETDLEPATAVADQEMMRQVFFNLASNAFKAMPESGTLTVTLRAVGDRVRIGFKDTGFGMNSEEVERVFVPFNSSFRRGTGLGLSIVYQIVSNHDGRIDVESAPGDGTAFTIDIPRAGKVVRPSVGDEDMPSAA